MKVTKPEISTALLNLSWTAKARNHRYIVVAIMLASEKDKMLYTAWYCKSLISYIVMALDAKGLKLRTTLKHFDQKTTKIPWAKMAFLSRWNTF